METIKERTEVKGHALDVVSWITQHTVGWKPSPGGGSLPIIEPLPQPHARWYCECGAISARYYGTTKANAQARAVRRHIEHVEDFA